MSERHNQLGRDNVCVRERRRIRESEYEQATDERAVSERHNVLCVRDGVMKTTRERGGEREGGRERERGATSTR